MKRDGIVLIWGIPADPPLTLVYEALQTRGCPVVFLDQRDLEQTDVDFSFDPSQNPQEQMKGSLRVRGTTINFQDVRSIYMRPYHYCELPAVVRAGPDSALWRHGMKTQAILESWADLFPALVIGRPEAMSCNASKPRQAARLASMGFNVPSTLITTDPDAAFDFWQEHTEVVYKSISGTRSIVSRLRPEHRARLDEVTSCPTQFQQYIRGVEYRVHVVGQKMFACRILCGEDDYRYAKDEVPMEACELPRDIAERCRTAAAKLALPLAGIDLRCSVEGVWYCLEVNPSPGFSFFQWKTGQPIAEAIADLLEAG